MSRIGPHRNIKNMILRIKKEREIAIRMDEKLTYGKEERSTEGQYYRGMIKAFDKALEILGYAE